MALLSAGARAASGSRRRSVSRASSQWKIQEEEVDRFPIPSEANA